MFSVPLGILFGADVCFSVLCFICPQQILMYSDPVDRRGIHPKVSFYFFGVDYAGRLRLAELPRTGL